MERRNAPKPPSAIVVTSPEDVKPQPLSRLRLSRLTAPPWLLSLPCHWEFRRRRVSHTGGCGGIDFDKLEAARKRLGIEGNGDGRPEELDDPAFSRRVRGLDDEQADRLRAFSSIHPE